MHHVSRSESLWISTCTCVQTLRSLMMVLRLTSNLGSHLLAAVSAFFNFIKEPWPVFACNFFLHLHLLTLQKIVYEIFFFAIVRVVTYMAFSFSKLKSLKHWENFCNFHTYSWWYMAVFQNSENTYKS